MSPSFRFQRRLVTFTLTVFGVKAAEILLAFMQQI